MPTLEEEILSQIKGVSLLIRTDAIYLSDRTQIPNFAIENIEEQLNLISHNIGCLNEDIDRYRVKKNAQLGQTPPPKDSQLTTRRNKCPAPPKYTTEAEVRTEIKEQCRIITAEVISLEDMTKATDLTVEGIEEQLGKIIELIRSVNDDIEQHRRGVQLHQATQARDNQR